MINLIKDIPPYHALNRRADLRHVVRIGLMTSLVVPLVSVAQQEPEVEEVVVTGSYIRNSAFAQNSPVDTVTQEDLFESGAPSMGASVIPRTSMW